MLSIGELFARYISLSKKENQKTLFGVLITSALATVALGIFYGLYMALYFVLGLSSLVIPPKSNLFGIITILDSILQLSSMIVYAVGVGLAMVATTRGALRLINSAENDSVEVLADAARFTLTTKGLRIALLFMLSSTVSSLGFAFLIVPGVILMLISFLSLFRMVEHDEEYVESLKNGWKMLEGNLISCSVFSVCANIILTLLIVFTCGVFSVVSFAATVGIYATIYASIVNKPIFSGAPPEAIEGDTIQPIEE